MHVRVRESVSKCVHVCMHVIVQVVLKTRLDVCLHCFKLLYKKGFNFNFRMGMYLLTMLCFICFALSEI